MKQKRKRANQCDFSKSERDKALSLLDDMLQTPEEAVASVPRMKGKGKQDLNKFQSTSAAGGIASSASEAKGRKKKRRLESKANAFQAPDEVTAGRSQMKKRKKKHDVSNDTILPEAGRAVSQAGLSHHAVRMAPDSEESEIEIKPEEEQSRALSVLDEVLKKSDDHNEFSDDDLHMEKRGKPKNRKVFIGNLPWSVDADTVQQDMEKFGEIDSCNMPMNKETGKPMGIAFIVYSNSESAERALALNGQSYNGRKIRVSLADADAVGKHARPKDKVIGDSESIKTRGPVNETNTKRSRDLDNHSDPMNRNSSKGKGKHKGWKRNKKV